MTSDRGRLEGRPGSMSGGRKLTVLRAYAIRYLLPLVEADCFGVYPWKRGAHFAAGLAGGQGAFELEPLSQ